MIRHGVAPYLECSTRGDRRFSAMCAVIAAKDGTFRTIESMYQAAKVFEDGTTGLRWREAKGRRAINQDVCAVYYGQLWDYYISRNPYLLDVLRAVSGLSDMFGQPGHCCQATELWRIRNAIFVFGSNLAGRHGAGAALFARERHGAVYGRGEGLQGYSYAIPTKNARLQTFSLDSIAAHVATFLDVASTHSELTFNVTRIGCGLAGYNDAQIAPMFADAPANCVLPEGWRK
jgi:hypothetical protein